ncbi:hypothetical protein TKK_0012366 [Trichogramma kaykai]
MSSLLRCAGVCGASIILVLVFLDRSLLALAANADRLNDDGFSNKIIDNPVKSTSLLATRGHKHWLLFLGGLKSVAAVVLLKFKIILMFATIVAVVIYTIKYLLGPASFSGIYKGNFSSPPVAPYIAPYHHYHHDEYLPNVVHDSLHSYGYAIPWDHHSSNHHSVHEEYNGSDNKWSKIGDGGRSSEKQNNLFLNLLKIMEKFSKPPKKKIIKKG